MPLVLLDTNKIILHVAGFERLSLLRFSAAVSTITVFELLRYPGISDAERSAIESILVECLQIPVSGDIARTAASLGKTRPKMKSLDLLIAATALELNVPLITKNTRDFKGISGLKVREEV